MTKMNQTPTLSQALIYVLNLTNPV